MKKAKRVIILSIIIGGIIGLLPNIMETEKLSSLGLLIFILPIISLEFLIPSELIKKINDGEKMAWYSKLLYYLLVFPVANMILIISLNGLFNFLPELTTPYQSDLCLLNKEAVFFYLKLDALIYLIILIFAFLIKKYRD